jgi:hypothetical protein
MQRRLGQVALRREGLDREPRLGLIGLLPRDGNDRLLECLLEWADL